MDRSVADVIRLARAVADAGVVRTTGDSGSSRDRDRAERVTPFRQAVEELYSPEWERTVERLRRGDTSEVEAALRFLEADPWCFRSGYYKERLLKYLSRMELTSEQEDRLRRVVLASLDAGYRREFKALCRAAASVWNPRLSEQIADRLDASGWPALGAAWMLEWVHRKR